MFGSVCLVYLLCFDLSPIISPSMSPTLQGNGKPGSDWILSEKVSLWFRNPRRWEVIQFASDDQMLVAKRVVGMPGEIVSLQDKRVAINGIVAPMPDTLGFLKYYAYGNVHAGKQVNCGAGYYVLGDDSHDSDDSRFNGPLLPARIRARAWLRVWPLSRFGWVNP